MKNITVIPARKTAKGAPLVSQQKLKVAAYCRVSTDSDEQATSYDAQIKYWCCTIKVDIGNSKSQYIAKDKQEATKDGSESTKIQHGI